MNIIIAALTCFLFRVHLETDVTAPPGAMTDTPMAPSRVGPMLLQV